jgi:purine-binding chemotaxis protein CheW
MKENIIRRKNNKMAQDMTIVERQLVLFDLGGEVYGVDIASVHEIIRMQPIIKVPKAPFFVEGVINLRGKVIPVVDMRRRFGLDKVDHTKDNRIVVVDVDNTTLGIIVDAVTEVLRIPADAVEHPSDIITANSDSDYLMGIAKLEDKMVILLDLSKVLPEESIGAVIKTSADSKGSNKGKTTGSEKSDKFMDEAVLIP